jgi:predicted secreted protein
MASKGNYMSLKRFLLTVSFIFLTLVPALWAGDTAVFVDLGFSPDGRNYMFGQYGVLSPTLMPWAELYIVDVRSNNFVQNGRVSYTHSSPIKAGQDGSGIFYRLITDNSSLASRYGINYENQGQPLYISRDENPPATGERIDFRDFISGKSYNVELVPSITGSGQNTRSSFFIRMEVHSGNQVRNHTIGSPQIVRSRIASYNIKRVLIDPSGDSLIFIIEMRRVAESGFDIRYMVETFRF